MKKNIRRKRELGMCVILLFVLLVSGCGKKEPTVPQPSATTEPPKAEVEATPNQISESSNTEQDETLWDETNCKQLVPQLDETKYAPLKYSIDHYALPEFYQSFFSPSQISSYYNVVNAYLNYETSATYENEKDQDNLWGLLKEDFPLFYSDVVVNSIEINEQKKEIHWSYSSKTKEEHDALIAAFTDKISGLLQGVSERDTDTEKAFIIYMNFIRSIEYDYEAYEAGDYSFEKTSAYTALVKGEGICMSFSKGFAYLLTQVGINGIAVDGEASTQNTEGHAWTMMQLNGSWYFSDPTWDAGGGNGLQYFAFTGKNREDEDGFPFNKMTFCSNGDLKVKDHFKVNDTRFKKLRKWVWAKRLDRETDELVYVLHPNPSEKEHRISMN